MTAPRICHVCGASNPPHARYCNQCGANLDAVLNGPGVIPSEERRWVTVLFADLVNYTALLEHMDPEEGRDLVSSCFDRLGREIVMLGGTLDKFMGDAVMAIFGAPISHEDDPARALRAALRMRASVGAFNAEREVAFDLRIGINSGQVVVGSRQVGGLTEYTATGDAVNVASRLQNVADPGQIVVGAATIRQAGLGFLVRTLPAMTLRGKQDAVDAFLLDGEREDMGGRARGEAPLVNRRSELTRLRQALERLTLGRGHIVLISGEPGIGKSRLIAEAQALAPESVAWAEGRARVLDANRNYAIFRTAIDQGFGIDRGQSDAWNVERVRARLDQIGTPFAFPYLARVANLRVDADELDALDEIPQAQLERRVIHDLSAMIEALARVQPLVLAMDDLHWADPASLALLNGLMPVVRNVPLLLLLSFRAESDDLLGPLRETARTELRRWSTELALRPLTPRQSVQLLDELLGDTKALSALRTAVQEKADGNPLYIEEIVRSLDREGAMPNVDLTSRRGAASVVRLPISLQGLILSRFDRLPDATRQALQVASVIGREFDADILEQVDPVAHAETLAMAAAADLIVPVQNAAGTHYAFRHALARDAIYRTLLLRRRRDLHTRVLAVLAAQQTDLSDIASVLAFHAREAQRWSDLVTYATLAGDRAMRAFASRDAIRFYTQALETLDRLSAQSVGERRIILLRSRGRAAERTGDWPRAQADYQAALELGPDGATRHMLMRALSTLLTDHDDYPAALDWARQSLALAQDEHDQQGYARALSLEARVMVRQSRAQEGVERLTQALEIHRAIGDRRGEAEALDNLAAPLSLLGDVDGAYERQRAAMAIFAELGDREREADVRSVLAEWQWYRGDFQGALEQARRARAVHERLRVRRYEAHDRLVEGMALATLGQFREALSVLEAAVRNAEQMDHSEWVAHALVPLGVAQRALRRYGRARHAFARAAELGDRIGARFWSQLGRIGLGFTAVREGHLERGEEYFRDILKAPEGLQFSRSRAMTGLAMVELERGNAELADDWVRWSIAIAEAAPYMEALLESQILHGQTLAALGRRDEARAVLTEAIRRSRELSARPLQAQGRRVLSALALS